MFLNLWLSLTKPKFVQFNSKGCQAEVWEKHFEGIIVGILSRQVYGSSTPVKYYKVLIDGIHYTEKPVDLVVKGTEEMSRYLENPCDSLVGKFVLVI